MNEVRNGLPRFSPTLRQFRRHDDKDGESRVWPVPSAVMEVHVLGLIVVVVLGAILLFTAALSRRLRVAPPVLLLFGGIALGFVPALRTVQLPPDMVLLLFLPLLL